jgi:DNA helicase-2/ATP-dependent DNA helicase PcrA
MMDLLPPKSKGAFAGFVADLDRVRACEPESRPADAIAAVLKGAYPRVVKTQYDNAENRLADLEQLAVLAARYDSLDRFLADLVLAGDVYGAETFNAEDPSERLVLSTVHQAKGLEWKRVFVIRLVEEGFPSARSLREPGGEEEERRIFYVAVTRAQDELVLTYPQMTNRPGRGTLVTRPSRFLTELEPELYETVRVESQNPLAWGGSVSAADSLPADPGLPDDPADGQD